MKIQPLFCRQAMVSLIAIVLSNGHATYGAYMDKAPWQVVKKSFTPIPRAADIVTLPGERQILAAMELGSNLLFRFNASNGELLDTQYTRESTPQCLVRIPSGILLVQDRGRTPEATTLSLAKLEQKTTLALPDFRLYRVAAAATSQDSRYLWLSSCYTMSSLYGHINSALFRVDLREGICTLVQGSQIGPVLDRHVPNLALPVASERNWLVSATLSGEILLADIHTNKLSVYKGDSLVPARSFQIPFIPKVMPRECNLILPLADVGKIALLNLEDGKISDTIEFSGTPLAICISSDGRRAFISISGSNEVLQIDLLTGELLPSIDFSRTEGKHGSRDSSRGYDTFDIVVLRWADTPPRLIGLGYDGYILMIADLSQIGGQTDTEQAGAGYPPQGVGSPDP